MAENQSTVDPQVRAIISFQLPASPPVVKNFWAKVDRSRNDGCWLWSGCRNPSGYGRVRIQDHVWYTHRIAVIFSGTMIPEDRMVLHRCDNPPCCNPDHLFLGTRLENMADCKKKERFARGEKSGARKHPECVPRGESNGRSVMTARIVLEIRTLRREGVHYRQIAMKFGMSVYAIYAAVNRVTWKHVE